MIHVYDEFSKDYPSIARGLTMRGHKTAPRGMATFEIRGETLVFHRPDKTLLVGCGRKLNLKFAAAEALQLIGGFSDPKLMELSLPAVMEYANTVGAGPYFFGAYGPRLNDQLGLITKLIRRDLDTRQAVATVWQGYSDAAAAYDGGVKDIPCTTSLQFFVRENELELHVVMRSNDVWKGLSYDAFQFSQLQYAMYHALADLGITVGAYYHHPISLHAYRDDMGSIAALGWEEKTQVPIIAGIGRPGDTWQTIRFRARAIARNDDLDGMTPSEEWYAEQMAKVWS